MKKFYFLLIALLFSATIAFAQTEIDGIYYNLNDETQIAEVTYQYEWSSNNYSGVTTITIPEKVTYNSTEYSVTSIGDDAFRYCSSLTSITIPNSVTSIGDEAFSSCDALTSITIGNSVTSIGISAFHSCSSLTSIEVDANNPNYASIEGVLYNKDVTTLICWPGGKTSITIPNSVTSIGRYAFAYCWNLTSITIPNSVTSIGDYAFRYCSSLTSITIPNSVASIGNDAFEGCTSLTSITIPNSVTSIGYDAFYDCSSLTSIEVDANNQNYASIDGVLYNKDVTTLICCPSGKTSITIPNSVTSIGDGAFLGCSSLTSITIPNSVTSIGYAAFYYCHALTSISIPNSVTSIGDRAFDYCPLIDITCYAGVPPTCSSDLFSSDVYSTATLTVPEVSKNDYLITSPWDAFLNVETMDVTYYQLSVTSSDENMGHVSETKKYYSPNEVVEIWAEAYNGYKFTDWSDGNTDNPRTITMTGDLTLTANFVVRPYEVTLTCDETQGTVSGGGEYEPGSQVTITATAKEGYQFSYWRIYYNEWDYNTVYENPYTFEMGSQFYDIEAVFEKAKVLIDGVYYYLNDDNTAYVTSPNEGAYYYGNVNIHNTITVNNIEYAVIGIPQNAFSNAIIDTLTIPANITTIGYDVFYSCSNINYLNILDLASWCNVTINDSDDTRNPFQKAQHVLINGVLTTDLIIPEGVTRINNDLFYGSKFTSVTFPSTLTEIGTNNFVNCNVLQSITFKTTNPPTLYSMFSSNNYIRINVPCGAISNYENAYGTDENYYFTEGEYALNVSTNYPEYANVEIQDNISCDDNQATIYAYTTYIDLRFVRWSDGSIENPRTITVTSDTTLVAEFELCYSIQVFSSDESKGTVTGGGQFSEGDTTTITAIPAEGYMFDYFDMYYYNNGWYLTTSTENPLHFDYINQHYHFIAHFKPIPVLIDGLYYDLTDVPEGITVRFYNAGDWSQVNIWAWNENGNLFEEWPGVPMNNEGNGWWSYTFDPSIENINLLFNDGGYVYQTADIVGVTENICYEYAGDREIPYSGYCLPNEPTAIVTYAYEGEYSGVIVVPDQVVYNNKTYKVTYIEEQVFAGHPITSLTITNNVIDNELSLYGCYNLEVLKAHADLIDYVYGCYDTNIEELYITGGYIEWLDKEQFTSLEILDLSATENYELSYNFFKGYEEEDGYEGFTNLRKLVLPNDLTTIYDRQFRELWSLEEIVIPNGVTEIPEAAFYDCHALSKVTLSKNLTSIGNYAFYSCHALENIVIPEGVTEIGNAAFYGCSYLENIELPSTLEEVGNNAFALCSKVKSIKAKAHTPPTLWAKTFYEVDRNTPVYVAEIAYDDYVNDLYWSEFFNIIPTAEYNEEPTDVENATETAFSIYTQGGMIYIEGVETDYNVFDASGRLIYTGRDAQLQLPRGVYMIHLGGETQKVVL